MPGTETIDRFLQHAGRRSLAALILKQATLTLALLLGGIILLLVLGTQILDWPWLVGLALVSLGLAAWRIRRAAPSTYSVACLVDHRLGLHDALSTAWHFRDRTGDVELAQRRMAERLIAGADPRAAVPLPLPRGLWAAGALAVVALGLIAVRYGSYRELALRAPVAPGVADLLRARGANEQLAQNKKRAPGRRPSERWQEEGIALNPQDGEGADGQNQTLTPASTRDNENSSGLAPTDSKDSARVEKIQQQGQGTESADGEPSGEGGEQSNPGDQKPGDDGAPKSGEGKQQNAANRADKAPQQPGTNSSLMSKMKEAMENLLSKLKSPSQPGGDQQQNAAGQKNGQQSQQAMRQRGQQKNGQQQQPDGQNGGEMQSDQQGDPSQQAQKGNGQSATQQASDRRPSPEAKSGVGKEDGAKDLAAAQQQAAMGKISEILGRRSQNVTGDITVEVNSGRQQLRTAYSQKSAGHAEAAGEIHRDEVPLALQAYVQQYFEHVRKTAPKPKAR